jgi:hypothetical protein
VTKPSIPIHLGTKAKRLWSDVVGKYDLRADELRLLEDACREIDIIERLEVEFRGADTMVKGSMGQLVASPLLQELRQHRAVVARLLGQLKLPDEDAERAPESASDKARRAANTRWSKSGS